MTQFLQYVQNSINTVSIHTGSSIANILVKTPDRLFIAILPFASAFNVLTPDTSIPCTDPIVEIISGSLGRFLYMLMEIGGILGIICIILGGLLRIASLTTQKKEDKDDRMFLSQFSFVCAVIVLIPTFIFFILLVLLPYWYGLGNTTCH